MKRVDKIKNFKIANRQVKMKRMRVKNRKSITIREVSNDNLHVDPAYNYVVHLLTRRISYEDRLKDSSAVKDFSNHGFSGKWLVTNTIHHHGATPKLIERIYLEDESDLIMLRLCTNLHIDRILKINH